MLKKLIIAIVMLFAGNTILQAAQNLTLGYVGGKDCQQNISAIAFISVIDKQLPGQFKIEEKGGTTLGGEVDVWNAVKLGVVDMAIITTAGITTLLPQLGILSLPYIFRDFDHADKVLDGPIGKGIRDRINDQGVFCLGFAEQGFRHLTNSKHPVDKPSDIVGLKIRVIPNPICEETFRAFGAKVVPMPWPGVYGALRDNRIDGQENPILTIAAEKIDNVQKFVSLTGHFYSALIILVNADIYRNMKPQEQEIFKSAARSAVLVSRQSVRDKEKSIIISFKQKGIKVNETIDRDAFIKSLTLLWPEWEKRFGADMIKRIRETK